MKYFLAILLLFAVTCATVEEKYLDVDNAEDPELEFSVKKIFKGLKKHVQNGIKWLKDNNLWDPLVDQVKKLGKKLANVFCTKVLKTQDNACDGVVDFIGDKFLKSK